jgi:hypothetical protein
VFNLQSEWNSLPAGTLIAEQQQGTIPKAQLGKPLTIGQLVGNAPANIDQSAPVIFKIVQSDGINDYALCYIVELTGSGKKKKAIFEAHRLQPQSAQLDAFLQDLWIAPGAQFETKWAAELPTWGRDQAVRDRLCHSARLLRVDMCNAAKDGAFRAAAMGKIILLAQAGISPFGPDDAPDSEWIAWADGAGREILLQALEREVVADVEQLLVLPKT